MLWNFWPFTSQSPEDIRWFQGKIIFCDWSCKKTHHDFKIKMFLSLFLLHISLMLPFHRGLLRMICSVMNLIIRIKLNDMNGRLIMALPADGVPIFSGWLHVVTTTISWSPFLPCLTAGLHQLLGRHCNETQTPTSRFIPPSAARVLHEIMVAMWIQLE